MITSAQNAHLKLARALHTAKGRRRTGAFLLEGIRLIEDAWQNGVRLQWVGWAAPLPPRGQRLLAHLQAAAIPVDEVAPRLLNHAVTTTSPQPVLAIASQPAASWPPNPQLVLIPDQVRDPGNLGTLIRSAAAFAVDAICLPPGTSDPFAPKVVRAGMGAHFRLPLIRQPWAQILSALRAHGMRLALADMHGDLPGWAVDWQQPTALIIGGEAEGASPIARQAAELRVRIPMPGQTESLNAGVAGSLLLYEATRPSGA